jgi:hypothetical protein
MGLACENFIEGGKAPAHTHVRKMLKRFGELVADLSQLVEIVFILALGLAK